MFDHPVIYWWSRVNVVPIPDSMIAFEVRDMVFNVPDGHFRVTIASRFSWVRMLGVRGGSVSRSCSCPC